MSLKHCNKGRHEMDVPVFSDPILGGLLYWQCECGAETETTQKVLDKARNK